MSIGIWCAVIAVLVVSFGLFVVDIFREQNKDIKKEPQGITGEGRPTELPTQTGGFGFWSKVALWLIVIFLGLNVCQMFSMRNQTENLHKDIHKIMGLSAPNLTDCQDRINRERLY